MKVVSCNKNLCSASYYYKYTTILSVIAIKCKFAVSWLHGMLVSHGDCIGHMCMSFPSATKRNMVYMPENHMHGMHDHQYK